MNICVPRERSRTGGSVSSALSSVGCNDDDDDRGGGDAGGAAGGGRADGEDAGDGDERDEGGNGAVGGTRSLVSCSGVGLLSASVPIAKPTARQRSMLSSAAKNAKSLVR